MSVGTYFLLKYQKYIPGQRQNTKSLCINSNSTDCGRPPTAPAGSTLVEDGPWGFEDVASYACEGSHLTLMSVCLLSGQWSEILGECGTRAFASFYATKEEETVELVRDHRECFGIESPEFPWSHGDEVEMEWTFRSDCPGIRQNVLEKYRKISVKLLQIFHEVYEQEVSIFPDSAIEFMPLFDIETIGGNCSFSYISISSGNAEGGFTEEHR